MRYVALFTMVLLLFVPAHANKGSPIIYQIDNQPYEGFYISSPSLKNTPLLFLINDWVGLIDYEKRRAHMLSRFGDTVFAMDLFGKGIRPIEIKDKRHHTEKLYKDREEMRGLMNGAFEKADKKS